MKKYIRLIGLFILILILLRIDFTKLFSTLLHVNIFYLFCAVLLNVPHLFFKSLRWNLLLKKQGIHYSLFQSYLVYMSALYIGYITPGRLGEFVKVLYLKSDKGISLSKGFSNVLLDRVFDLYILVILGFIGIWKFDILSQLSGTFLIISFIFAMLPLIIFNKQLAGKFFKLIFNLTVVNNVKGKIEKNFEDFYDGVSQLIDIRLIIPGLLTCIAYAVLVCQAYILVLSIGQDINIITVSYLMAITSIVTFIPITVSGIGTRDSVLIYLFSILGLTQENALVFSFLIFITLYFFNGIIGAIYFYIKPILLTKSR